MKKLYEKNALWFAILLIIAYCVLAGNARGNFGDAGIVTLLVNGGLTALILWFLAGNQLWEKYGLTRLPKGKPFLWFFPFVILGLLNFDNGIAMQYPLVGQLCALCSMACVGFLEEILFRGFLFEAIAKENRKRAILISALTFGAGHIINLLTGHAGLDTVLQICYASAIGFAFVIVYDRSGSLWPCILCHCAVDMAYTLANTDHPQLQTIQMAESLFIIVLCTAYALYLIRKFPREQ